MKEWNFDPSAHCINAQINSISPSAAGNIYSADYAGYISFNVTIYPYDDKCNAGSSYAKTFSTGDTPNALTVKQIADNFGTGVYTFSVGSTSAGCGSCGFDSIETYTCANVDIEVAKCKECRSGSIVNKTDGTLSSTDCCFDGEKVSKTGHTFDELLEKCPMRTQNTRQHEIDGCSGGVSQNPGASAYAQASTTFGTSQGTIGSAADALNLPCNQHDICYQACKSTQAGCDSGMRTRMDNVCTAAFPSTCPYSGWDIIKCPDYFQARATCFAASATYYYGLRGFGNSAWEERQTQYCDCCP